MAIVVTAEDIQAFLDREFPQSSLVVEEISEQRIVVRKPVNASNLRPGGTVSGPTMMATADSAAYVAVLAHIGIVPMAVTSNLNINFLRKPEAGQALIAYCKLLHLGRRSVLTEVNIFSEGRPDKAVAHAMVTYAIPSSHQQAAAAGGAR